MEAQNSQNGPFTAAALAAETVAEAGRQLLQEGLVARTWGNVSCRTGKDSFAITPSGLGYDVMRAEDVAHYCMADGSFTGTRKPSSEKGVHTAAYAQFPDAGFVIHTHQCYASALSLAGFERLSVPGAEVSASEIAALGGVALAEYGLPGTKKLAGNVANALATGAHCVLMAHHGALIVGRDRQEAFLRAQALERLCRSVCLGQPEDEPADIAPLCALMEGMEHAGFTASPAVIAASRLGAVPAQLDDLAQMIGASLPVVKPEKSAVAAALKKRAAVLVEGLGAVCRAQTEGDLTALRLLVEKACVSRLHTRALHVKARLSPLDTALMRAVYVQKYEKKIGG